MASSRSPTLAFIGRVLLAFLFLSSGAQKLATFDARTGGPVMGMMAPKMDHALKAAEHYTGVQLPIQKEHYVYLLGAAVFLELAGGILFIFNSNLGALMLLAFTVAVSPVMHNFWDIKDENTKMQDMINFFKNVAICGGLLAYMGGRARA